MADPNIEVVLLSCGPVGTSPIHDRYLTIGTSGIKLGSSFNGYGGKKVAGVTIIPPVECADINDMLSSYACGKVRQHGNDRVQRTVISL